MKVYRHEGLGPILIGDCDLTAAAAHCSGKYHIFRMSDPFDGTPILAISLRHDDNPERLPGWRPMSVSMNDIVDDLEGKVSPGNWRALIRGVSINTSPPSEPRLTIKEMAQSILMSFAARAPASTYELICGYLIRVAEGRYRQVSDSNRIPELFPCGNDDHRHGTVAEADTCFEGRHARKAILLAEAYALVYADLAQTQERIRAEVKAAESQVAGVILCRSCRKPLDHLTSSAYCLACQVRPPMGATHTIYGSDPDGSLIPLPQKPLPKEKPFVPNKFGEH